MVEVDSQEERGVMKNELMIVAVIIYAFIVWLFTYVFHRRSFNNFIWGDE